ASRYAVKATPVYDQDGAGGNMGNPAYAEYFPDFTNGEGLNKGGTQGHPGLVLPIPTDQQQFNGAGASQGPSSLGQVTTSVVVPEVLLNGQPLESDEEFWSDIDGQDDDESTSTDMASNQLLVSPGSVSPSSASSHNNPPENSQLVFHQEQTHPAFNGPTIKSLTSAYFMAAKANIGSHFQNYAGSQTSGTLVPPLGPYEPTTVVQYELAANKNYFIFFMYVHPETKEFVIDHPYSDPAHQQVDYEKLAQLINTPQYFLTPGVVPLNRFHNTIARVLSYYTAGVNKHFQATGNIIQLARLPPKNALKF
ncbi:hypothetical protein H4R34_006039, partial [Dimargaris verticillata]